MIIYLHILIFVVPVRIAGINSSADDHDCLIVEESNTLTCILVGVPQPTIHWYIGDDNTIVESSEKYTIRGDQLVINNVSLSDINTFYGCAAHNFANGVMQMDDVTRFFSVCRKPCSSCSYSLVYHIRFNIL